MVSHGLCVLLLLFSVALGADQSGTGNNDKQQTPAPTNEAVVESPSYKLNRPVASQGAGSGIVAADPIAVVGGLLAVIVLIIVTAWLMRRVGGVQAFGGQSMKVLAALSVGAREKVVLVDVAGTQILLGVAPGRVSHLQTFEQPVVSDRPDQRGDFTATIKKLLHNKSGESASANESEKP